MLDTNSTCKCLTHSPQNEHSIVAMFTAHSDAEEAINNLQKAGYDMRKLSIIGKDYHTEEHWRVQLWLAD